MRGSQGVVDAEEIRVQGRQMGAMGAISGCAVDLRDMVLEVRLRKVHVTVFLY